MSHLATLGETMGLFVATEAGSLELVNGLQLSVGGAESNVAVGVARLGGAARWVGRVGSDEIGRRILRELRAEGVGLHVTEDRDAPTGIMVKSHPIPAVSRVVYHRRSSAGSRLSASDVRAAEPVIATAGVLHVTGITPALSPDAAAAIDIAMDIARAHDVPVSFDVNHRSGLWTADDAAPVYRAIAARASIVFAGAEEAAILVGAGTVAELLERLSDLGPAQVIVKLGADGCRARIDGQEHVVAAVEVKPVDTVGAGDAFVAGYLTELLDGASPAQRLSTAVRAGAFACLGLGDWEAYPTRTQLLMLDAIEPVYR